MKKIVEERQLTGVYGPLIDNFVLKKEEAAVAVDVTAGNRSVDHKLTLFVHFRFGTLKLGDK